jgi:hypothetical protein
MNPNTRRPKTGESKKSTWSFDRVSDRQVYVALILITALIRLPFLRTFEVVAYDGTFYLNQARTLFSAQMAGSFPIGYPSAVKLLQLGLRDYQIAGMAVSFLAGIGSVILTWRIARHFVRRELALLAALAVAFNPLFIRLSLMTLSESLYTFFVLLGLSMFVEKRWLPFGLAMGAAAITRPEAIAIVGLLGLTQLRHPKQLAIIAMGFLVIYAANSARLSTSLGRVVILPKSEFIGSSTRSWKLREVAIEYEGREKTDEQIAAESDNSGALVDYGKRLPSELLLVVRHVFPAVFLLSLYALRRRKYWFMAAALASFFVIPLATVRSIDRYLLPYIPVLILLAVFALGDIRNRTVRLITVALVAVSILILPAYNSATLLEPEEENVSPLKEAGLEFRGDVKPGDKIADRKPYFAFYSGGDYLEIPVAPYEEAMNYLAAEEGARYMVLHQQVIHRMRPAFRPLMYSKAVMNGELRFRQVFYDSRGVMLFQRVLDEDPLVPEATLGLTHRGGHGIIEGVGRCDDPHALAAASRRRLHEQREPDRSRVRWIVRARERRNPGLFRELLRGQLVSHALDGLGRGADPSEPGAGDVCRKARVLREEAVAGMDRLGAGRARRVEDRLAIEVATGQANRLVGICDEGCVCIGVYIDRNTADPHLVGTPYDPAGDLSPVRNQQCFDAHSRKTPYPSVPSTGLFRTTERQMPSIVRVSRGSMMPSSLMLPVASRASEPFS